MTLTARNHYGADTPDDRIWALKAAADPSGMMPNAESTAKFLKTMEIDGLVRQSDTAPVWFITDAGRSDLAKLQQHPQS